VAEAGHLQGGQTIRGALFRLREEIPRAETVADRPRADSERVERLSEERIEGDDFVHVAAPDVHVVGERVGELRGERSDLTPDPTEIVEQAGPLARKRGKQRREPQDVDGAILCRA
jgi:hypothetical protein